MNTDEIVRALRISADYDECRNTGCKNCPADALRVNGACDDGTMLAAANLIESLQAQLAASQARERAAKEVVRCKDCRWKDTVLCRASKSVKYDLRREKHTYKTFMEPEGFCNIGERGPQEAENSKKQPTFYHCPACGCMVSDMIAVCPKCGCELSGPQGAGEGTE